MNLFERGQIGTLCLKNRIIMEALNVQLGLPGDEAALGQRALDFYVARAKGGVGLIKTTFMQPNRKLELPIGGPVVNTKRSGTWLNEIAEAIHDYGAKICVQLSIGLGRIPAPNPDLPHGGLVSPSPLPSFRDPDGQPPRVAPGRYPAQGERHVITRGLKTEEIEELVRDFEFSARIIALAGVDAIEIHAHQGYLLDEFMTSLWNRRTDSYGGDLNGRLRLALELVGAVRRAAGPDYPVLFKYPLTHGLKGGREIDEGLEIARRLEAAGVNALTVNSGCYETYNLAQPPTTAPRGSNLYLSEMTRRVVTIPVISSGKLGYPELAEQALQDGKGDFISLGRPLLADPEWPNKVKEGRTEDIKPCIGCHQGCIARIRNNHYCSCAVNPAAGVERRLSLEPAERTKSVLVIGGGPAGMEVARVAALRGHRVTLWEKEKSLGGNLALASKPRFKEDYTLLLDYLRVQLSKLRVTLELEKEATPEMVLSIEPDVVFVAIGSVPTVPDIEGIKDGMEKGKVFSAADALLEPEKIGESVLVMGGGHIGCEVALFLAQEGKEVVLAETSDSVAGDMVWGNALDLVKMLDDHGVRILMNTGVASVGDKGIELNNHKTAEAWLLDAETVVMADTGRSRNRGLEESLEGQIPEVYSIGDCVKPRWILNAIWEGYRTARLI
jgi:2-enoate reductase